MEFIVNESGCIQLSNDMLSNMQAIERIIATIDSQDGNLKAALGDDYDAIAKSVRYISSELGNAYRELRVIVSDMNEYMSRVQQARVSLD